jgi:hypothetical protein
MDADLLAKMLRAQSDQAARDLLGLPAGETKTATDPSTQILSEEHLQALWRRLRDATPPVRHFAIHGTQDADGWWRPTFAAGLVGVCNVLVSEQAGSDPLFLPGLPETVPTATFQAVGVVWHITPHIKPGECYELDASLFDAPFGIRLPIRPENFR